jgi:CRP-like cAMP-binding protein
VILEGTARVIRNGRKVSSLGPGASFGEIALLLSLIERTPRTATVVTETPVRCFVLSKGEFRSVIYERNIAANLLHNMAQMLDAASTRPSAGRSPERWLSFAPGCGSMSGTRGRRWSDCIVSMRPSR